jgi:hypothetical protein
MEEFLEVVVFLQSAPELYIEDKWDKPVSHESEVSIYQFWAALLDTVTK